MLAEFSSNHHSSQSALISGDGRKLLIRSQGRMLSIAIEEIDFFGAAANYVRIHCASGVHRVRSTIGAIEQHLSPEKFYRIHRCTIVNFDRIAQVRPAHRGDYLVTLGDGTQLKMSRKRRAELQRLIDLACGPERPVVKYADADQPGRSSAPDSLSRRTSSLA
jgi:DNA-binding LytR/AlgR family response regulator